MLYDFEKRLPNALKDRGLDHADPEQLIQFLSKNIKYFSSNEYSGAIQVVSLSGR